MNIKKALFVVLWWPLLVLIIIVETTSFVFGLICVAISTTIKTLFDLPKTIAKAIKRNIKQHYDGTSLYMYNSGSNSFKYSITMDCIKYIIAIVSRLIKKPQLEVEND